MISSFLSSKPAESKEEISISTSGVDPKIAKTLSNMDSIMKNFYQKKFGGTGLNERVSNTKRFFGDVLANAVCYSNFMAVLEVCKTMPINHGKFMSWCDNEYKKYTEDATYGKSGPTLDLIKRKEAYVSAMGHFEQKSSMKWSELDISWSNVVQAYQEVILKSFPAFFGTIPMVPKYMYIKATWMAIDLRGAIDVAASRLGVIKALFTRVKFGAVAYRASNLGVPEYIETLNLRTEGLADEFQFHEIPITKMDNTLPPELYYKAAYLVNARDILQASDFRTSGRSYSKFQPQLAMFWEYVNDMCILAGSKAVADMGEATKENIALVIKKDSAAFAAITDCEKLINAVLRSVKRKLSGRNTDTNPIVGINA